MTSDPAPGLAGFTLRFVPAGPSPLGAFLQEWSLDRDHIEPGEFESEAFWFARDAVALAQRTQ